MNTDLSPYQGLVGAGLLTSDQIEAVQASAARRNVDCERILLKELGIPRCTLLDVLAQHYQCAMVQYDERLPVPRDLFADLEPKALRAESWFPVRQLGDTVVVAAANPQDPVVHEAVRRMLGTRTYEFRVALREDIRWYIQDYLHAQADLLIGIERTGLAYWRNTMAHWRTKLAAHRTAHARARTSMKLLRWGLAMIALANVLTHLTHNILAPYNVPILVLGVILALLGLGDYLRVRGARMDLPCQHELFAITTENVRFTGRYHLPEAPVAAEDASPLAKLAATIPHYCSVLRPVPASKERTHLARERNMLAAQRTIASSHRTSYARARTGLSLIRTGVAFIGLALAIHRLLGTSPYSFTEYLLFGAGVLMFLDGLRWYLPARRLRYGLGRDIKP